MKKSLYPITYNNKKMYEDDCDPLFAAYYLDVAALNWDMSVYVSNDIGWVYPDGKVSED